MIRKRPLRPPGMRQTQIVLAALLVIAGGLAAVQKWSSAWWGVPVAAGIAGVVAGAGPMWQRWREYRAAAAVKVRRSLRGTQGSGGDRLPVVAEVDLRMLRVHPAVIDVPYLHRTLKEEEVRKHLMANRPVLLVGSSMVGKTRLAAVVVRDLYPDRHILIPDSANALTVLSWTRQICCQLIM
jgi:hypothetical protein